MKIVTKHPLVFAVSLMAAVAAGWGCKNFLEDAAAPQGTLDENTLKTKSGVEGALIAAYRALDWTNGVGGNWGSAASNWVWASVTSDDAYKGSEATDQPDINDVEAYHWSRDGVSERYLNDKWKAVYEGVVRTNAMAAAQHRARVAARSDWIATTAPRARARDRIARRHEPADRYLLPGLGG